MLRKSLCLLKVKSREKSRKVRENWSQHLELSKSPKGGRLMMSGRISVPGWHAIPVANVPWKPLAHNSVKVNLGIKVKCLISWVATGAGQVSECYLRPYVRRKSDLPKYIGQIHAFYFDTTPYTLNDNVNTKSVWLNKFDRRLSSVLYGNDLNDVSKSIWVRCIQRQLNTQKLGFYLW